MAELAEKLELKNVNCDKLIPNLFNKKNYVLRYENAKLISQLGYKITKIHKVLQFSQETILKDYIMSNTFMRTQTKLESEKDLYKLINNSIFSKTMEDIIKHKNVKIVNTEDKFLRNVSKATFNNFKIFNNDLILMNMNKKIIKYNKPIIIGFTILELSKVHMQDFYYNVMKKKYNENMRMVFTDTDSLFLRIKTEDYYKDIGSKEMKNYFDF